MKVLRQETVECTKTQVICRLKKPQGREVLLEDAIANQLSLNQIKQRIQKLEINQQQQGNLSAFQYRWRQVDKQLRQQRLWEQPEIGQELECIMAELECLVAEVTS